MAIALPPIMTVGSDYIQVRVLFRRYMILTCGIHSRLLVLLVGRQDKVCKPVITGEKVLALAITEPYVGSDVAGMRTTARRDGDFYVLNGESLNLSYLVGVGDYFLFFGKCRISC